MFAKHLFKSMKFLRTIGHKPAGRRRAAWSRLTLEHMELRDVPAPLTWAAGVNLPAAPSRNVRLGGP